jgi:hypothetical protein
MTIQDILSMPKGMTPEQWEKELKRRERIRQKLHRLSVERDCYQDKLDVLSCEEGSERYNWTKKQLDKVTATIEKLRKEVE